MRQIKKSEQSELCSDWKRYRVLIEKQLGGGKSQRGFKVNDWGDRLS